MTDEHRRYPALTPRELPDLRLKLHDFWTSTPSVRWSSAILRLSGNAPQEIHDLSAAQVLVSVAVSELIYVDETLSAIAHSSELPIKEYGFMPWDLPTRHGFMYFAGGTATELLGNIPTPLLLTWNTVDRVVDHDNPNGVVDIFAHMPKALARERIFFEDPHSKHTWFDRLQPEFVLINYLTVYFAEAGEDIEIHANTDDADYFLRILFATCHLLRQQLADTTVEHADRASRRRHQRAGLEPPQIRVNRLRKSARPESTGESQREWHHRWIVRGHWRRQWYPSIQAHRPKWIAPYPKGPDGAPLLGGQKVYTINKIPELDEEQQ